MEKLFTSIANSVAHVAGRPITFICCCAIIVIWACTGPLLGFSDTWQLIINTGTTIVTFLMVFLIQNTQNRDGAAIHAKLDDLIRSSSNAHNSFIGIEHLQEKEVEAFRRLCEEAAIRNTTAEGESGTFSERGEGVLHSGRGQENAGHNGESEAASGEHARDHNLRTPRIREEEERNLGLDNS